MAAFLSMRFERVAIWGTSTVTSFARKTATLLLEEGEPMAVAQAVWTPESTKPPEL
jgi:hypothetical protein